MIFNIGLEAGAEFLDKKCNSYLITGTCNVIIDTVPETFEDIYVRILEKYTRISDIQYIYLLSAAPERSGCVSKLLEMNPNIVVYSTVAGLNNLREILNTDFNGCICKNGQTFNFGEDMFTSYLIPNLTWPDTMALYYHNGNLLFSGELFSSLDIVDGLARYFHMYLRFYVPYVKLGVDTVSKLEIKHIYPAYGEISNDNVFEEYNKLLHLNEQDDYVLIVYSSKTGKNKILAETAEDCLTQHNVKTKVVSLDEFDGEAVTLLKRAKALILGTYTENRSMPECVWDFLSNTDVNLVKGKPYFVFTSFGWSCEAGFLANEILSMLKMRRTFKMVECNLTPDNSDLLKIKEATASILEYITKEKSDNV